MSEVLIEKGIPIPEKRNKNTKYPFADLSVGDSIFCPTEGKSTPSIVAAASRFRKQKNPSWNFVHERQTNKDGKKGVRLWRVA